MPFVDRQELGTRTSTMKVCFEGAEVAVLTHFQGPLPRIRVHPRAALRVLAGIQARGNAKASNLHATSGTPGLPTRQQHPVLATFVIKQFNAPRYLSADRYPTQQRFAANIRLPA